MPKINVYVPDALLAEVRAAEIAVSGVCQAALEAEVRRRAAVTNASRELHAVAARLVGTREQARQRSYDEGVAFGVRWARELATLDELEVAQRAVGRTWEVRYHSLTSLVGALRQADPDLDIDADDWLDGESSSFDRGLLDGAAEVYRAVEPLLADALHQDGPESRGRTAASVRGPKPTSRRTTRGQS